jgi:hypothetical protein
VVVVGACTSAGVNRRLATIVGARR